MGMWRAGCGANSHVRFGGRARETDRLEGRHRALVRPYENAVVLCVDEKTLDRTAPILPMRPGLPARATHDYVRHGTTSLFAALEVANGRVTDACYDRHTNAEFLDFLKLVAKTYPQVKLHIVADNYATHKHPNVKAWLARNPRITMHFTPTSGSWLNMVEIFFARHHPASDPPRNVQLRQRPHRRHRRVHRRLERTLPPIHLDQNTRRNPDQGPP